MKNVRESVVSVFLLVLVGLSSSCSSTCSKNLLVNTARFQNIRPIYETLGEIREANIMYELVELGGLKELLESEGMFTVFAPGDQAFGRLPLGGLEMLRFGENKAQLNSIMKYHVIPGIFTRDQLALAIEQGKGVATFKTLEGETIAFQLVGKDIVLIDARGRRVKLAPGVNVCTNGLLYSVSDVLKAHHAPLRPPTP